MLGEPDNQPTNDYTNYDRINRIDAADDSVIGVIANEGNEAVILAGHPDAVDGEWEYRLFPTLDRNRVLVAVNADMIERRAYEVGMEEEALLKLQQRFMLESMPLIIRHFAEQEIANG